MPKNVQRKRPVSIPAVATAAVIIQKNPRKLQITESKGDILHVRYSTHDEEQTRGELLSILGAQDYEEKEWNE